LYALACPNNFLHSEPNYKLAATLLAWMGFQVAVLVVQVRLHMQKRERESARARERERERERERHIYIDTQHRYIDPRFMCSRDGEQVT
jgi:hypothetical protein